MNSSYDKLKAVCRKYLQSEDVDEAMHTHQCRVNKTYSYFSDKGLSDNESKALAFSLSSPIPEPNIKLCFDASNPLIHKATLNEKLFEKSFSFIITSTSCKK